MNRNWFIYVLFAMGLALPCRAQLQFTNATGLPIANVGLNAVAYDGINTFVVVGDKLTALTATFATNATNLAWVSGSLPGASADIRSAAAFGNGQFVAGGTKNTLFVRDGTNWVRSGSANKVFSTTSSIQGLAFNTNLQKFAASSSFVALNSVANPRQKWTSGKISGASYLESYRGLTPYSSSGFAVVGIKGVIRVSRDGGLNWNTLGGKKFKSNQPDLYGIATDGAQGLVAVGKSGAVWFSTDGGANFVTTIHTEMGTINNAVAHAGDKFIAVGNGGRIFTISNNAPSSILISNQISSTTSNLTGVTFATDGLMKGVAMVVGKGGKVLLGGTPPPKPIFLTNQTICEDATIPDVCMGIGTNDLDHPPGTIAIDWYDRPSGGSNLALNTTCYTPPSVTQPGPGANFRTANTYFAEARDLRTGIVNTNRTQVTLTINPRPTSSLLSFDTTNCNVGMAYTLTNTLTGLGPWTVVWSSNDQQVVQRIPNAAPGPFTNTFVVVPTNTSPNSAFSNVYYVLSVSNDNTCVANQLVDTIGTNMITINPRPTSDLLSFAETNCNIGTVYTLTNILTGLGPWTLVWSSNGQEVVQTVPDTVPGPFTNTFVVVPTNTLPNSAFTNVYYVLSVSNENTCVASQPGDTNGQVTVTINPRPASELLAITATNCNVGTTNTLTYLLTGLGPWTLVWSSNDQQVVQVITNAAPGPFIKTFAVVPTNTSPNSAFTNVYYVLSVSNENTCVANQPGDIIGTNTITINPRPTSDLLSFAETNCNIGTVYTLTNILTGLGPWTLVWSSNGQEVVQTVPDAVPGPFTNTFVVVPTNTLPNLDFTNIYYVLSISNENTCVANQPGDTNGQVTVTIHPRPASDLLSFAETNCNIGTSYTLTNILTGLGPWTVVWSSNDQQVVQVVTNAFPGPFTNTFVVVPTNTFANASVTNSYFVLSVSNDTTCVAGPSGDVLGKVDVTINPRPTSMVLGTNALCNSANPYFITNILTGHGPWIMMWSDGVQRTNFTSGPGPVTNFFAVFPTNTFLNEATNFTYAVTNLTDVSSSCSADPARGDLAGTNLLTLSQNLMLSSNEPTDQSLCPSMVASFSVAATGTGIAYQWNGPSGALTEGAKYAGVTNSTLYITNVLAADAGVYRVDIVALCGVTNRSATLTVLTNVSISAAPANSTVCPGSNAVFNVTAEGTGITYQWVANMTNLLEGAHYAGVTSPTLTVSNASSADGGTYTVVVSGICSSSTNSAILMVSTNASVITPPADLTVCAGSNAVFTVVAEGSGVTYQWVANMTNLLEGAHYAGVTSPTLTVSNASSADAIAYTVMVSGNCGGSTGVVAILTVSTNVSVTMPPVNLTACPGSNAVFTVAAEGTGLSYQWQANMVNLMEGAHFAGVTSPTLTVSNASSADAGTYTVVVSGSCGSSTNSAMLMLSTNASVIMPPADLTVCPGNNAVFTVVAEGTGVTYQWVANMTNLLEGAHYAGVTSPTLTVSNASSADAVAYTVMVSGNCGSSTGVVATLNVLTNVSVTMPPVDLTVCPGSNAVFTVVAEGTGITYQWVANMVNLIEGAHYAGVMTPTLTVSNASSADAGIYTVIVSGCDFTNVEAMLTVNTNVSIIAPPVALTVCPGSNAVFTVQAAGGIAYQWQTNGSNLVEGVHYAGVTTPTLTVSNASLADAVIYTVVVSGNCGSLTNAEAMLTVSTNVSILTPPGDLTLCPDTNGVAIFHVVADGAAPFTYQWQSNGVALVDDAKYAGTTTDTLSISNIVMADAGTYGVVIGGACGGMTSTNATLTIAACALAINLVQDKVVLQWQGNLNLACTTNLGTAPWMIMARGLAGRTNYWTNSVLAAPTNAIFRLSAP